MPSDRSLLATNWSQVVLACTALLIGSLVYLLDRPPDSTAFLTALSFGHRPSDVFGWIGGSLPTFTHTFSLSVLTAVWLGRSKKTCVAAAATWLAIDSVFEIGQQPQIAEQLISLMPQWFERLPVLAHAEPYFLRGTFDAWDMVSIVAGATAAWLLTALSAHGGSHHV